MMDLQNLRIVADERERKCGIPNLLKQVGLTLEIEVLPVGDYIVASETIVERKSISDFVASVFDGRLFDQCARLKEHFDHPVLALEGNTNELSNITENPLVFYGALSRIVLEYGIPVIPTPNAAHTAKLLISMAVRKRSHPGPLLKKIRKYQDTERQQLTILCSLPGVGTVLGNKLLQRFETPMAALGATSADLAKVLGRAKATQIRHMLDNRQYKEAEGGQQKLS